jgi:hypothetical protein
LKSVAFGRFLITIKVFVLLVELCKIPLEAGAPIDGNAAEPVPAKAGMMP